MNSTAAFLLLQLFQISWRNIFRNKRRTALTLATLAIGMTGLILIGGFFDNMIEGYREYYIHSQVGHLQVNASGYYRKGVSAPFSYLVGDAPSLERIIKSHPDVRFTVPHLYASGIATSGNSSLAIMVLGTDPIREMQMGNKKVDNATGPSVRILEGSDLDPADPYGAVLGRGLLKTLGLTVGDSFVFLTTRENGTMDGAVFRIRGAFETIVKDFDDRSMKVNLRTLQTILAVPERIHSWLVILDDTGKTEGVKADLEDRFREVRHRLEIISWEEQGHYYRQSRNYLDKIFGVVQLITGIIFVLGITNTVNMEVLERMREFGTMMAIGNNRTIIFSVILLEAFVLAVVGSVLGLGCGSAVAAVVSRLGIEMPPPPQGTSPYIAMITLSPRLFAQVFSISFASTLLASLIPGYRASRIPIVQALGYV